MYVCVCVKVFHAISIGSQLPLFGALAMPLREVNISLIMSVRMEQRDSHRPDFGEIYYLGLSTRICPTSIAVKSGKNEKYNHEDVQNFIENFDEQSTTVDHDRWKISLFTI